MLFNRRKHKRFKLSTEITAQIIDQNGSPVGLTLNGCLQDISAGGACFTIQNSNEDFGQSLLEERTTLTFPFKNDPPVTVSGLVVGVKFDLPSNYTINLQFAPQYLDERLNKLIGICQKLKSSGELEALHIETESLQEPESELMEALAKSEPDLASLSNFMDELNKVQQKRAKDKQPPKVVSKAKAPEKSVVEIRKSRNKPAEIRAEADREAPSQKPMPSQEEIAVLTRAINKDPEDAKLTKELVDLYSSFELYEEAIKSVKAVIKLTPKVAELHYLLGDTYYRAERFQESLRPFSLAVQLNPKLAKAHYFLSMVNELVGKEETSQKHYQIAIALDPDVASSI